MTYVTSTHRVVRLLAMMVWKKVIRAKTCSRCVCSFLHVKEKDYREWKLEM